MATTKTDKNMRVYAKVQDTPVEAQKSFNNGRFSGTDINPMWRIKKLTEIFGPAGFGWWTQNVRYDFKASESTKDTAVFCELELIVKDPETGELSQPIYGVGGNMFVANRKSGPQSSDEAMKMAYTDALSIACKALGFSADIYFAQDRTKYTAPSESGNRTSDLLPQIRERVTKLTASLQAAEKQPWANEHIVPYAGVMNYNGCKDPDKLEALLKHLNELAAA